MVDKTILVFKCLNTECAKPIKLKRPLKSGIYPVTCPHCKAQKKIKITGMDSVQEENDTNKEEIKGENGGNVSPGKPDNSNKPAIKVEGDFLVNEPYKFKCPHCGIQEIGLNSQKPGPKLFTCPYCEGKIELDVREKTKVVVVDETNALIKGKLVLLRKGWLNKNYPLGIGVHTVGREDKSEKSDISIKNDNTVSRRSIKIEVNASSKGFTYKMTVLKATNPVLHNNTPLSTGESIFLNFGDTLLLGKTKFRFDADL